MPRPITPDHVPKSKLPKVKPKSREPLWRGPVEDGVTASLLSRYLSCKERFRLLVVEGLTPAQRFNSKIEFGNLWHAAEEALAGCANWKDAVAKHAAILYKQWPFDRADVGHWEAMTAAMFPHYVDHWASHPDVTGRTSLFQEQVFSVNHVLPSGRTIQLRGKWDSADLINGGVWLMENKTKSSIDRRKLERQMRFDLQTGTYLVALWNCPDSYIRQKGHDRPRVNGVRYNVIRRSSHKSCETMLKKMSEDRTAGRIDEWFLRLQVDVSAKDSIQFRDQCLDPVLENLCDDYEWWKFCKQEGWDVWDHQNRYDAFVHHRPRHFRMPYFYSPLAEGGFGEVDEYLETGNPSGLIRTTELFPELKGGE